MTAIWDIDFDYWAQDDEDGSFIRPMCPKCREPIFKWRDDDKYHCVSCGEIVEVTDGKMLKWFADRAETKTEMHDCFSCGGKGTVETRYYRDDRTLAWRVAGGECKQCKMRFIV